MGIDSSFVIGLLYMAAKILDLRVDCEIPHLLKMKMRNLL